MQVMKGKDKFTVLLCGKKDLMERIRRMIIPTDDVHLQFTSSPGFVVGRAMFSKPDVVLIDTSFDHGLLQEAISELRSELGGTTVFTVSTDPDHREVVELMKFGASGYFGFPGDYRKLNEQMKSLLEDWRVRNNQKRFIELQQRAYDFNQIIGRSPRLLDVLHRAKKVIDNTTLTVLITGETGTGKELLARAIHYNSKNNSSPFVDIACSALPENLLESELFGFEKGAFTDARERKYGLFEVAGDGTIFLDEIGDISPAIQSKLLKVIDGRTMRRVGGLQDIPVKARIIAATSVDLEAKMKAGTFRKDLYHRLKIIPLEAPPLRERKDDIPLLVENFIGLFNRLYNKKTQGLTPQALDVLYQHDWEGNVRELKHCIERAILLEEGSWLTEQSFLFLNNGHSDHPDKEKSDSYAGGSTQSRSALTFSIPIDEASMEEIQRRVAQQVLEYVRGNKSKAAYILRVSRPRLDRILKSERE